MTQLTGGEQPRVSGDDARSRWLAAMVESSDAPIIGVGLDLIIVSWNGGAQLVCGYSAEEAVGQPISMLIENDEMTVVVGRIGRGERAGELEMVFVRKDGRPIDVAVIVSPVMDAGGSIAGASAVFRDISHGKRIEQELRRSNAVLEQFAHGVSHDLSEPLRVISGFVDLLARRYRGQLDDEADRFIELTIDGVTRMQELIDDLLAYSRARRVAIEAVEVDLRALLDEVLATLGGYMAERGALVDVGDMPIVRAPPAVLRQVFQNLIGNAIKFTTDEVPRVRITAVREGGGWRFDVRDNGPGIDPADARRAFEMFQRLHGRDTTGSGMGLAIAKQLVESSGGRIWVHPGASGGSVFSFTIP